ncbi:MAG: alpha-amylase, partial [Acidimicrobiia bacterium]
MTRPQWVLDAVFYQIFPDRFRNGRPDLDPVDVAPWGSPPDRERFQGGDLRGIREGLGHLESLRVTA